MIFESIRDDLFVQECICERIENQINLSNFQTLFRGLIQRTEACKMHTTLYLFLFPYVLYKKRAVRKKKKV